MSITPSVTSPAPPSTTLVTPTKARRRWFTKKRFVLPIVGIAVFIIVASVTNQPATTPTVAAAVVLKPTNVTDVQYLGVVKLVMPNLSDSDSLGAGHDACAALKAVPTAAGYARVVTAAEAGGKYGVSAAAVLVSAAVTGFCPTFQPLADSSTLGK